MSDLQGQKDDKGCMLSETPQGQDLLQTMTEIKQALEAMKEDNRATEILTPLTASLKDTLQKLKAIEQPKIKKGSSWTAVAPRESNTPSAEREEKRRQLEERRRQLEQERLNKAKNPEVLTPPTTTAALRRRSIDEIKKEAAEQSEAKRLAEEAIKRKQEEEIAKKIEARRAEEERQLELRRAEQRQLEIKQQEEEKEKRAQDEKEKHRRVQELAELDRQQELDDDAKSKDSDDSSGGFRPSASELDEKRRLLEQKRRQVEQEKREAATLKKKLEDAAEKKLREEEAERQNQAKAKADMERREKLEEIVRLHKEKVEKVSLGGGRRASAICRDLQGYRVTRFTSQTDAVVTSFGGPKEFAIFFNLINVALHEEPDFQMLPLMGSENRNFEDLSDGIIICKYINKVKPDSIDMLLTKKATKISNWTYCLRFLEKNGIVCLEEPSNLAAGNPEAILKVTWEVIKFLLEDEIKKQTKTLDELFLSPEDPIEKILTEWINLLVPAETPATSISTDFQNSYFYIHLCHILLGTSVELAQDEDKAKKAKGVVQFMEDLELGPLITIDALLKGTFWANYICLCKLFLHTNA